jgi:hypothetical protein
MLAVLLVINRWYSGIIVFFSQDTKVHVSENTSSSKSSIPLKKKMVNNSIEEKKLIFYYYFLLMMPAWKCKRPVKELSLG